MKLLPLLLAVVLVQRCASQNAVREVTMDNADARVIGFTDRTNNGQRPTLWNKAQFGLAEQQPALSSKDPVEAGKTARSSAETTTTTTDLWPRRWIKFLDGSWLNEFWVQCERDPVFRAGATQNFSAMQAFVAFVSIGYAVVAMWLGPIKLTHWQRRSVLVTYTAAGIVQAVFLAHASSFMDIHYAYPSTLLLVIIFFVAFNLMNALLVLESEESEPVVEAQVQQIVEVSSTRVITAERAACC
ncbi:hypothetical protein F441_05290 [Phytophthora nicotianae CJ01A1]|uniref:Uncharacterized protein n=5 Tax=Phytophthora nicotianae TaxID=4792 RepID=W2QF55_PHYN3|nr:hypothetical protein PPTG_09474 [Phytophthora nicotianae INRA-310]ETI51299.1 hypothetical protein F443_05287 [Phytophthora nicotianae P1569]ETK91213.1 hypothetical protein L915_05143 [Phytophthora nicotianae]ETO80050.1 hypothetical protein F444_05331 [Phytophthora nicotianae P1976]ETP21096.1 hypothetical protein F441_05290 [Phytophthora nicotianae CJ01A1]ETL44612.1 hypothetical protein L916_05103 [Phytophthora nicotianae]